MSNAVDVFCTLALIANLVTIYFLWVYGNDTVYGEDDKDDKE